MDEFILETAAQLCSGLKDESETGFNVNVS